MFRRNRCRFRVLVVSFLLLLPSCSAAVRTNGPRPGSGAATIDELVAVYRQAHENNDPEKLRSIDMTVSLLADWVPMNKNKQRILRGLFELKLEDVRAVEMPVFDPHDNCLHYVCPRPNGEEVRGEGLIPPELYGRVLIVGRRPDGVRVTLDPAIGITRMEGRFYVEILWGVAEDAVAAMRAGAEPRYRLVPHGTDQEYDVWSLKDKRSWGETVSKLDELEKKSKELETKWKADKAKLADKQPKRAKPEDHAN